ncbi:ABC transporter ATP-binding protein [Candidatus Margulisiibacteriota bacterium]
MKFLFGIITTTPRYKLILFMSLLSGSFNFVGLPMLIPIMDSFRSAQSIDGGNQVLQVIKSVLTFLHIPFNIYSVLTVTGVMIFMGQMLVIVTALVTLFSTHDLIRSYSKKLFKAYLNVNWPWLTSTNSGELNYVVLRESAGAATGHMNSQRLVLAFVQCSAYLLIALRLSFGSVLLVIFSYGFLTLFNLRNSFRIRKLNQKYNELFKKLSNSLAGFQQNKKFLKTSLLNRTLIKGVFTNLDDIIDVQNRSGTRIQVQTGMNWIMLFVMLAMLGFFRSYLGLTFSRLIVLVLVFNRIQPQFDLLTRAYSDLNANVPMLLSIRRRLADMAKNQETSGTIETDCTQAIRFDDVNFSYQKDNSVIQGLNVSIEPRRTTAFIGGSGAGKSTILDLLLGLLKPQAGKIYYGDIDHNDLDLASLRSKVAYVNQTPTMLDGTLRENLAIGCPGASDEMIDDICRKVHLDEFIKSLPKGLDTLVGENGICLSGGQRQRVVLARSLFMSPMILILDEATSELDLETEKLIQETLNELRKDLTIIIVAHRLSTVKSADLIYVLENGQVCESGTYKELLDQKGRLYYLDSLQKID